MTLFPINFYVLVSYFLNVITLNISFDAHGDWKIDEEFGITEGPGCRFGWSRDVVAVLLAQF